MPNRRPDPAADTPTRILDVAERLVQTRGFNGFSYADVAAEVGVTKASLHYHFAGKAELGAALIERYAGRFSGALGRIDRDHVGAPEKLAAFTAIYAGVLRERRMCLCGMLAADYETLPPPMQDEVLRFFNETEAWLAGVIRSGVEAGELRLSGSPASTADAIVSGLEGAMLIARPFEDVNRFESAADRLIDSIIADRTGEVT